MRLTDPSGARLNIARCRAVYLGVSMQVAEAPEVGPSDAELIGKWRRGEEAAATELVRRHAAAVARYLSAAGAGEDVDDLVQEAFFRAFRPALLAAVLLQ